MGKYDFGLVIEKGSTHEWAFDHVEENSNVLELGAANGLLTNALHNGKNCIVDIVELDEEAGMQASTYSRNAILGARGDLNGDKWCESLSQNEYDYVVILDVLEHLDNPLKVLEKVKSLLKQEGKLLLSIPNIAHNSVVISLLKGKFEYTKLGLLDSTHRYFVTYESAQELVRNAGFSLEKVNAIKKTVGDNEITVQYSDVDPEIRYYLRNRLNGEIYQTLIVAGKYETEVEYLTDGESDKNTRRDYQAVILPDGKSDKRIDIETHHGIIDYVVSAEIIEKCNSLRFIPMENDCIVCDLVVSIVDNSGITTMLQPNWFTGKKNEGVYIFIEEQHEVNYLIPQGYSGYVHISAKCYPIFGDIGNCLKEYIYG